MSNLFHKWSKGSTATRFELIGVTDGSDFAELLVAAEDLKLLAESVFDRAESPEFFSEFDDFLVVKPGERRPVAVRSSARSWIYGRNAFTWEDAVNKRLMEAERPTRRPQVAKPLKTASATGTEAVK